MSVLATAEVTWESAGQVATDVVRDAVTRDEVAHAWLFVGPPSVGQREAVRALAAALNCDAPIQGEGCGTCHACRLIASGQHPAVIAFAPEGRFHLVESVRTEWVPAATRTSLVGRTKILHIIAADRMNEATQNAFLKVLEEPPASVVWILDVEDESLLLETVVSRCRRVDFRPWSIDRLQAAAAALGAEHPQATARAATGSPQRLHQLTDTDVAATIAHRRAQGGKGSDEDTLTELAERLSAASARRRHLAIAGRLAVEGPAIVVALARDLDAWAQARVEVRRADNEQEFIELEERFRRDDRRVEWPPGFKKRLERRHKRLEREERTGALLSLLDEFGSYLRDVLTISGGGAEAALVNLDVVDDVRRDAARIPAEVLLDGLAAISECREALQNNGNPVLQLERLLMRVALPLFDV